MNRIAMSALGARIVHLFRKDGAEGFETRRDVAAQALRDADLAFREGPVTLHRIHEWSRDTAHILASAPPGMPKRPSRDVVRYRGCLYRVEHRWWRLRPITTMTCVSPATGETFWVTQDVIEGWTLVPIKKNHVADLEARA